MEIPPAPELARLDAEELARVLQPLFGHGALLARAMTGVPFSTWDEVVEAASAVIAGLTPDEQLVILRGHARLGEHPRVLEESSQISLREQQGGEGAAAVRETLLAQGECYERKFGFPFVEFVAGRPLEEIIPVLEARLGNSPEVERATALRAIVAIADDRIKVKERMEL